MQWSSEDHMAMAEAIKLAGRASYFVHPNPRVGCVLVRDSSIVARGWHDRAGNEHAEVLALKQAQGDTAGTTCYVTLEPCSHTGKTPPCVDALISSGIRQVNIAMIDPNPGVNGNGIAKLEAAGIKVRTGLMQEQAERLNPGFIKRMRKGLPYVRCKMAMSLDGRTALASGESRWISSEPSRRDVHRLRARSSAILTGINTVLADDPSLTVRHIDSGGYQPLRAVVDTHLRISPGAALFKEPGQAIVFTISDDKLKLDALGQSGIPVVRCREDRAQVDLKQVLEYLVLEQEINEVLVEAGPALTGNMIKQTLVDELVIYAAPKLMGQSGRELFTLA
ncbi:MAG: bifunctional diaminohydroxyphosphoribosylaminopyrimidine deaminase/5-amino-6-(5-phosphoribosylamino)uracil reductase RibD, partial [Gammaproteobacteria bacterium]|nr:bifunctional diaminohydroxyphosphoribosylaminopyrimidine deaminase/5-amino-6-(5-phosphoribosylamino)uracil reductase RibD [Gammaproteobacteria bacterium]